jgi:hypothetical protein
MTNYSRIHVITDNEIIWVKPLNFENVRQVSILFIIDFYHEMKCYLTRRILKIFCDHIVWEQIGYEQILWVEIEGVNE